MNTMSRWLFREHQALVIRKLDGGPWTDEDEARLHLVRDALDVDGAYQIIDRLVEALDDIRETSRRDNRTLDIDYTMDGIYEKARRALGSGLQAPKRIKERDDRGRPLP